MVPSKLKRHLYLVKLACKEMVRIMLGNKAVLEINKVPLSAETVARHKKQNLMKTSPFVLQVDESTDCTGMCHFLIEFARFIDGEEIVSQFFGLKEMKTSTTGKDIFETIDSFCATNDIP